MENQVTFTQYAEAVPDDMNNLQQYVSDSIDHIVGDTLVPTVAYSGFNATKSGPAQVNIDPGRLYNSGKVYALTTPTPYDYTSVLPVAAKKIVMIAAWGSEIDTNATTRNVLIAAQSTPQNPVYKPQILELTHARLANLGSSVGTESPSPQPPVIDGTLLPIATIVLSPTGVDSVTNIVANQVSNLSGLDSRVIVLETFQGTAAPQLAS